MKLKSMYTDRSDTPVDKYFTEISKYKVLSVSEEIELFKRLKKGDEEAKKIIINSNLRFVVSVAKQYQGQGLPLIDLISEGNLGLIRAVDKFDYTKGFKFITYAVWWIKQSIHQAISEHSRVIRIPTNKVNDLIKLNKTRSNLMQDLEGDPNINEIAKEMNISIENALDLMKINTKSLYLEDKVKSKGDKEETVLKEKIVGIDEKDLNRDLDYKDFKFTLNSVLNLLTEKEKEIIKMYFGLEEGEPYTLEDIAEKFDITRERVRQIKESALRKLKNFESTKKLLEYV